MEEEEKGANEAEDKADEFMGTPTMIFGLVSLKAISVHCGEYHSMVMVTARDSQKSF
jgi:hypothetical protein